MTALAATGGLLMVLVEVRGVVCVDLSGLRSLDPRSAGLR